MSDCTLHDSGNLPPCIPEICPLFNSDDPKGDHDNMRTEEEVEGTWLPPNNRSQRAVNPASTSKSDEHTASL